MQVTHGVQGIVELSRPAPLFVQFAAHRVGHPAQRRHLVPAFPEQARICVDQRFHRCDRGGEHLFGGVHVLVAQRTSRDRRQRRQQPIQGLLHAVVAKLWAQERFDVAHLTVVRDQVQRQRLGDAAH